MFKRVPYSGQQDIERSRSSRPGGTGSRQEAIPAQPEMHSRMKIGSPEDKYEQEADRVADTVMRMPDPQVHMKAVQEEEEGQLQMQPKQGVQIQLKHQVPELQRMCPRCRERAKQGKPLNCGECEQKLQMTPPIQQKNHGPTYVSPEITSQLHASNGQGASLPTGVQREMSHKIGADFSDVTVHTNSKSHQLNEQLGAKAFTHGNDIYFNRGKYDPESSEGRHLLAHELTHVVQQTGRQPSSTTSQIDNTKINSSRSVHFNGSPNFVQRKKSEDPLCKSYVWSNHRTNIEEFIKKLKKDSSVENRLTLIRELKWTYRCSSNNEKSTIRRKLVAELGSDQATALWNEAGTPFGGYRGSYPGYYGGAKGRLKKLGTSEIDPYRAFKFDPRTDDASAFRAGRTAAAVSEKSVLKATDILYFYGHQYAQYKSPGVFANGMQTQFIDLRALAAHGRFDKVKLIISTSCATICKEAVNVFSSLFPNAVILGYRKSAPLHGSSVRNDFETGIRSLKRPLLLEKNIDVNAIIDVWKTVVKKHHPNEARRFPGYYKGGTVYYLEKGKWKSIAATNSANTCKKKGSQIREAAD
ncbi:eCIS core domain-containing protein [Fodinibius sediminis]|uniref:eCIS core domain-containing protein n=1 Tax=Fodinibius sediminis TaxID=1214077 RepID=A0A521DLE9_9BACT|nr:DUF4157 domain-containing protein [Fodinibius sediminis]SMO71760.1 protein of unknown function [Fodinibius sediminis]